MTVLSAKSIANIEPYIVTPFLHQKTERRVDLVLGRRPVVLSGGLSIAGYDIHLSMQTDGVYLPSQSVMKLAHSVEHFEMPNNVIGEVKDKSTLARLGLTVQNTVIEPGWRGYLTLELANHGHLMLHLRAGMPIAQVVFYWTDAPTSGYDGKYQDQPNEPIQGR